jgi:hypothetical protein
VARRGRHQAIERWPAGLRARDALIDLFARWFPSPAGDVIAQLAKLNVAILVLRGNSRVQRRLHLVSSSLNAFFSARSANTLAKAASPWPQRSIEGIHPHVSQVAAMFAGAPSGAVWEQP